MSTTAPFALRLQRQLYRFFRSFEQCEQLCARQFKVTAAQGYTLMSLPRDTSISMNELSESMGLANSTMTRMIDQLVEKTLVRRAPDREDRRVVRVELTAQGRKVRADLGKAQEDFLRTAIEDIPAKERGGVLQALDRIAEAFRKALRCCSPR